MDLLLDATLIRASIDGAMIFRNIICATIIAVTIGLSCIAAFVYQGLNLWIQFNLIVYSSRV